MLWVVAELHHPEAVVVAFEQVALRTATHLPNQTASIDGHSSRCSNLEVYMAEENPGSSPADGRIRTQDEVVLELMKFIAMTTGYGKGTGAAGFTGKTARSPEEYADALLQLFERCRGVVRKD